jgi:hypothetical protein
VVGGWRHPNRPTVFMVIRNSSVLGLNVHFGACSRFMHTEVRSIEPVPAKLEGGKWRRLNFFIVWSIEVS